VAIGPIPSSVPTLFGVAALGKLVALDPKAKEGEFRLRCGWYFTPKRRIRPGLWKVSLRGVSFNSETYPNGPASGIAHSVSVASWERGVRLEGWTGELYLKLGRGFYAPFLSNGPGTDICAGVLG